MKYLKSWLVLIFILPNLFLAGQKLLSPCYLLELESIGFPTAKKQQAAWPIHDLIFHNKKLYLGHGDAVVNTGPTDIIYYDLDNEKFVSNFTVADEAIYYYQLIDNTLMIPGIDATENWDFGNFYILSDTGWIKHRTIPNGIHVNHLASYDEKLFVSTGSLGNIGKHIEFYFGGIFCSADTGKTWTLSYATPSEDNSVYRIQALIVYKDKLYAFPFAYSGLTKEDIPIRYHGALSRSYSSDNEYLVLSNDIFGQCDVLAYDSKKWRCENIIPKDKLCYVANPFVFKNKLYIPGLFGEYIDYLNKDRQLVPQAKTLLFSFDGKRTKKVNLDYDRLADIVVKEDSLYLLIEKDNLYYIAKTENLKKYQYYLIPPIIRKPKSIEYSDGAFYIGSEDGNIFISNQSILIKKSEEAKDIVPRKIFGAAELPRDGKWYWIAITDLQNWGQLAQLTAEVKYGNIMKINTSNISKMSVFPPKHYLNPEHETTLIINGAVVYEGFTEHVNELICTQSADSTDVSWNVELGNRVFETYIPDKHLIGNTEIELTRQGEDPLVGCWKADVIKDAAGADLALISRSGIRNDIISSNIYLEDIYDSHYRNKVCQFKVSGEELVKMLEYNLNQSENWRCYISGFTVKYVFKDSAFKITHTTLKPNKKYTVATEDYLAERAQRFLGKNIDYTMTDKDTYQTILEWFAEHKTIRDSVPRIDRLIKKTE